MKTDLPPSPKDKRLFELLQKAYIDARYNVNYQFEKSELEYLADREATQTIDGADLQ